MNNMGDTWEHVHLPGFKALRVKSFGQLRNKIFLSVLERSWHL